MGSFFREQFDSTFPLVFGNFADPEWITYTDGAGTSLEMQVIWRAETTELVEDSLGNLVNVTTVQVVVPIDPLDGVSNVDWNATFTRNDEVWDIDTREGRGIESENPTFSIVHLISRNSVTISSAGRRMMD